MSKLKPWEEFERDAQELLGLRSTISSGSKFYDPSDGVDPSDRTNSDFLPMIDAKCTESKSFRIDARFFKDWVEKAQSMGYRFALPIRYSNDDLDIVAMTLDDFSELLTRYRESESSRVSKKVRVSAFSSSEVEIIESIARKAGPNLSLKLLDLADKMEKMKVDLEVNQWD